MTAARLFPALVLCLALPPSGAATLADLQPPIRRDDGGMEYMAGGQDGRQRAFLERVAPQWGATLEFVAPAALTPTDALPVEVRIVDRYRGGQVLSARAEGPLLLARLPPGTYEVEARIGPLATTQTLTVMLGVPGRLRFAWPSNVDFATLVQPRRTLAQGGLP